MEQLGPRVRVRAVEPRQGFQVLFTFEDGTSRLIDLEPFLRGPIFEPMRTDPARFRAMKIEGGTIAWDNGADIDPTFFITTSNPRGRKRRMKPAGNFKMQ